MTLDELRALAMIERGGYHVFEAPYAQMSVTLEDAEFLYALVRLLRPALIFEFGAGLGLSARFMAEAQAANGSGTLWTLEPNRPLLKEARDLLEPLAAFVVPRLDDLPAEAPDLVFIDSGFARRADDIRQWLTSGYEGIVVVHDSKRGYDLHGAQGVFLPGLDGMWIGRAA